MFDSFSSLLLVIVGWVEVIEVPMMLGGDEEWLADLSLNESMAAMRSCIVRELNRVDTCCKLSVVIVVVAFDSSEPHSLNDRVSGAQSLGNDEEIEG